MTNVSGKEREIERLNALIDGELDSKARAETLDAVAAEPALARELSALGKLKAVVEDSVEAPDIALPAGSRNMKRLRRPALALAASLVLAAVVGLSWVLFGQGSAQDGVPVAWAVEAHRSWDLSATQPESSALLRSVGVRADAYVPDLSAARLSIVHVGSRPAVGGGKALMVGYRGTRGCKVTLLVSSAPAGMTRKPVSFTFEQVHAVAWAAGNLGYMVLAEGMAPARFRLIAESIRQASLKHLPLDDRTRTALAQSRAASPPCAA